MDGSGVSVAVAPWRNWAGNQRARAAGVARPGSVEEVAAAIRSAAADGRRIKPVGSGHSFTDIACADDLRLDLSGLAGLVSVDRAERLATVQAGMTLRALNEALAGHGLALPNLGDIDAQTVAGAISTGTHGTGAAYGCLSTFVAGLTLVTGSGEVLRCSALTRPDVFAAAGVGLGALGVIVEVTLRCVDTFVLRADERPAALTTVLGDLDSLVAENDHFERPASSPDVPAARTSTCAWCARPAGSWSTCVGRSSSASRCRLAER